MSIQPNIDESGSALEAVGQAIDEQLALGKVKVPMMPQVAAKVISLVNDTNASLYELSELVHRDPSLAGRVLHAANSAAFGGGQEITTLQDAINRLGMNTLSEITLSASIQSGIFNAPGFEAKVNELWKHALASAYYAKEIAALKEEESTETMFLCGLLHAIGKPTVLQIIGDCKKERGFMVNSDVVDRLLDKYHCQISVRMAVEWKLPRQIKMACEYYRRYRAAPFGKKEIALIYLADLMANAFIDPEKFTDEAISQDKVFDLLMYKPPIVRAIMGLKETIQSLVAALN